MDYITSQKTDMILSSFKNANISTTKNTYDVRSREKYDTVIYGMVYNRITFKQLLNLWDYKIFENSFYRPIRIWDEGDKRVTMPKCSRKEVGRLIDKYDLA